MDFRSLILSFAITIGFVSFSWAQSASPTWTGIINCSVSGNTISIPTGRGGAYSVEGLNEATTGSVSYTLSGNQQYKAFGFTRPYSTFLHGAIGGHTKFYFYPWGATNYYVNDVYKGATTAVVGDVFKIERIGSSGDVNFYKNGTLLKTAVAGESGQLTAYVGFYSGASDFAGVTTDFTDTYPTTSCSITNASADLTSLGGIDLTVSGNSPFSYAWSNSATTQDLTGLSPGQYSVTVTDANDMKAFETFSVGHDVSWDHFYSAMSTGNTVTKTGPDRAYGGAITQEAMPANTDGWIEFDASAALEWKAFGLSTTPVIDVSDPGAPDFSFYFLDNGEAAVKEKGTFKFTISYAPGDVFRIERVGSTGAIKYYKEGNLIYTSASTETDQMVGMAVLYNIASTFENVRATFAYPRPSLDFAVTNAASPSSKGSLDLTVSSGTAPYGYDWPKTSETTQDVSDLTPGKHQVIVTDDKNVEATNTIGLGLDVVWEDLVNVTASGLTIAKTNSTNNWDAGAFSRKIADANESVWLEFTAGQYDGNKFIGFQDDAYTGSASTYGSLLYSFFFYPNGLGYAVQGLSFKKKFSYVPGDIFTIERSDNGYIHYYKNGKEIYVTLGTFTQALKAQAVLYGSSAAFEGVRQSKLLSVTATVTPQTISSLGSVAFTIDGGVPPYQILWEGSPFLTAADYVTMQTQNPSVFSMDYETFLTSVSSLNHQNIPSGKYNLQIMDFEQNLLNMSLTVGNELKWFDLNNVTNTSGVLTKDVADGWTNAYATTGNLLWPNRDGGAVFELSNTTSTQAIGFKDFSTTPGSGYQDLDYGFVIENQAIKIWESGVLSASLGTYSNGDLLAIERVGNDIRFLHNEISLSVIGIGSANAGYQLEWIPYSSTAGTEQMDTYGWLTAKPIVDPVVTHADCDKKHSASITLNDLPFPGDPPVGTVWSYTINWYKDGVLYNTGATTLNNIEPGLYSISLNLNGSAFLVAYNLEVAYKVRWTDFYQTGTPPLEAENTLIVPGQPNNYLSNYGTATSENRLPILEEGWISYKTDPQHVNHWSEYSFYEWPTQTSDLGIEEFTMGSTSNVVFTSFNNILTQGGQGAINPLNTGERVKLKRVNNGGTLAVEYEFNGVSFFSPSQAISFAGEFGIRGRLHHGQSVIYEALASFGCDHQPPHAILKRKLDAGMYVLEGAFLAFKYDEDYLDSDAQLDYYIYDNDQSEVLLTGSAANLGDTYGDNRYIINVTDFPQLANGFYILKVVNEKQEKFYTRFQIDI